MYCATDFVETAADFDRFDIAAVTFINFAERDSQHIKQSLALVTDLRIPAESSGFATDLADKSSTMANRIKAMRRLSRFVEFRYLEIYKHAFPE